jgi:DNA-binding PadR family transcriptional regulator
MARRRPDQLLPLETAILEAGLALTRDGSEFHGFALAAAMADADGSKRLTAHGTLYKALGRMTERGLLTARWEESSIAEADGRPRRRLYRVTGAGETALAHGRQPVVTSAVARVATT